VATVVQGLVIKLQHTLRPKKITLQKMEKFPFEKLFTLEAKILETLVKLAD
jgi:hypothetical protein